MLYNLKILFTSSLKFLSSLYLSSASLLNVGCFFKGPPSLSPPFCVLSAPATAMSCIAALVALDTTCAIASSVFVHSPLYVLFSANVFPIRDFYSRNHIVFLAFVKITPVDAYMHIYSYCVNLGVNLDSRLYT